MMAQVKTIQVREANWTGKIVNGSTGKGDEDEEK